MNPRFWLALICCLVALWSPLHAQRSTPTHKVLLGVERLSQSDFGEAAALLESAVAENPRFASARAWLAHAYHLQRRLDEAGRHYKQLLEIEPVREPTAEQRRAILKFAPRVFQVRSDPFDLRDAVAIHHPDEPLIAYHFFWLDDIDFPEDHDPCDHELVWVRYDPATQRLVDFVTYFHGRMLSSPEAVKEAAKFGGRPRVNVQWGKHGSMPHGWEDLQITPDAGDVEREYFDLQKPISLKDYNFGAYNKLHREGRRLRDHPLSREWPKTFKGEWLEFITFDKPVDVSSLLSSRNAMAVSRWNNAALEQHFLAYNFRPKTEWPDREDPRTLEAQLDRRVGASLDRVVGSDEWTAIRRAGAAQTPPGIVAHRGVIREAPENTIPAIEKAIELGCAFVEIDLRYSADGHVVLMHDETLERTTNGVGRVSERTMAELRQLDAGNGARVPTLREVIDLARGRIRLYLDLKESDPRPVARLVREMNAGSFVYFRPYSYTALRQILDIDPRFRVLVDLEDWMGLPEVFGVLHKAVPTAAFSGALRNWNEKMLAEARRLGVETFVNVLGAEDTDENRRQALRMGFDFIQTDDQASLIRAMR